MRSERWEGINWVATPLHSAVGIFETIREFRHPHQIDDFAGGVARAITRTGGTVVCCQQILGKRFAGQEHDVQGSVRLLPEINPAGTGPLV